MRIVLTGVTGFIGQNLLPLLQNETEDCAFLTLSRDVEKARSLFPDDRYKNFTHTKADDFEEVVRFNPDVCIHLATLSSSRDDKEIISPMLSANIEYGVMLLNALSQCNNFRLFVNVGSFAEYRYGTHKFQDAYLYTASKTAFRAFVDYYSHSGSGFRYVTAVPYSVYGGKMTIKRLMDYVLESLSTPVEMTKGEQVLDFIHVDDVARFFVDIVKHVEKYLSLPENGLEFHLGTGRGTSIRELASMIEELSGKHCDINWGGRPYRQQDIMYAVAPIGRNEICGWKAQITLKEGLKYIIKQQ